MAHYYIVFIKYNSKNYKGPDGIFNKYGGSFVGLHGYGHEEWNNSPKNELDVHGITYKVFHTQGVDSLSQFEDSIFFFTSSYKGNTYVLGTAVNPILNDLNWQDFIADELNIYERGEELWKLQSIRNHYNGEKRDFYSEWDANYKTMSWRVPKERFIWFKSPRLINVSKIRKGKSSFTKHYESPQSLTEEEANRLIAILKKSDGEISTTLENYTEPELEKDFTEGSYVLVKMNAYERNPRARQECIRQKGCYCHVCGFDFREKYGSLGEGFIHVHHIVPLHTIKKSYKVNPVKDLVPVCPNCHAMLHKDKKRTLSIEELKEKLSIK